MIVLEGVEVVEVVVGFFAVVTLGVPTAGLVVDNVVDAAILCVLVDDVEVAEVTTAVGAVVGGAV